MNFSKFKLIYTVPYKVFHYGLPWTFKRWSRKRKSSTPLMEVASSENFLDLNNLKMNDLLEAFNTNSNMKYKVSTIHMESTLYCNLRCGGCMLTFNTESGVWPREHMDYENFKLICNNLPAARVLTLHNYGEPSMNPKLKDMLVYAVKQNKFDRIAMTTNLLTRNAEYFVDLLNSGLSHMTVSIDSFDAEIAEKVRARTKVTKLQTNVEQVIKEHADKITIATVVSKTNIMDVPNTLSILNKVCEKFGQKLNISLIKFNDNDLDTLKGSVLTSDNYFDLNEALISWNKVYIYLNISLPQESYAPVDLCLRPIKNIKVTVDGLVAVCGRHLHPAIDEDLNNLTKRSYEEMVRDPKMISFLENFRGEAPEYCIGCESHVSRN